MNSTTYAFSFTINWSWVINYLLIGVGLMVMDMVWRLFNRDRRELQWIEWEVQPFATLFSWVFFILTWPLQLLLLILVVW